MSYKSIALLGDAPRFIVHYECMEPIEVKLGSFVGRRQCPRCKALLTMGVVVSAPATQPWRTVRRSHQKKAPDNDSPEGPAAA